MPFMSTAHFTISHHPSYLFADSPCTSFLTFMLPMSILSPKQLSYPDKPIIIPTAHALKPFYHPSNSLLSLSSYPLPNSFTTFPHLFCHAILAHLFSITHKPKFPCKPPTHPPSFIPVFPHHHIHHPSH
ncbi:hypothetical protein PVL29_016041 [Vitis rotundifolia]|uniref:Uncharacterized protein n=1 Tax=Vitis rotundifolia TaxID=103349 RepID=A0AA38ZE86_VITRO|nr:hypothetical protein PVL29_016041 [Vitis rotundifolia]